MKTVSLNMERDTPKVWNTASIKQATQISKHEHKNYLRWYEKHTNPRNRKHSRPGKQVYKAAIQGENVGRLTTHPLHQKLQPKTPVRLIIKLFKHKMLILWRQIQGGLRNHRRTHWKSEQKLQALQQREDRLQSYKKHSHFR